MTILLPALRLDPRSPAPLWSQIADGLRWLLLSGQIAPGEPLPSVRELAAELRVNPATVVQATRRLAEEGLVEVRRGAGSFAAVRAASADEARARALAEAAAGYAARCEALGVAPEEAAEALERAWEARRPARARGGA